MTKLQKLVLVPTGLKEAKWAEMKINQNLDEGWLINALVGCDEYVLVVLQCGETDAEI